MLHRCVQCDLVFNRVGAGELCPQCEGEHARLAHLVDDYLAYYPGQSPAQIAAATNAPLDFVRRHLAGTIPSVAAREARASAPACARCGGGRAEVGPHCQRCALEVRHEVRAAAEEARDAERSGRRGAPAARRPSSGRTPFRAVRYGYGRTPAGN